MIFIGEYGKLNKYKLNRPILIYCKEIDFKYIAFSLTNDGTHYSEALAFYINIDDPVKVGHDKEELFLPDDCIFSLTDDEVERHILLELI